MTGESSPRVSFEINSRGITMTVTTFTVKNQSLNSDNAVKK